ncbi:ABC transporter ATP-binding protein [Prochlorococcus sp. MIT 1223]|uniref:ABC transporter ATP-binding protein n=1 Tax=Prochlorococcus sp. MIT 1223 TaxID=3096217 RepID=UPI002A74F99C|nr:ABC transporter ATP-binding protein [Prochlorococcus sp. MIT 1223]
MINSLKDPLKIDNLRIRYPTSMNWTLNGLNLNIRRGERVALIGSSGCGKSTLAKVILQLLPPKCTYEGKVFVGGQSLKDLDKFTLQKFRGESVGLIFQDPMTRLNPLMSIGNHLLDTINSHTKNKDFKYKYDRACQLLDLVGIDPGLFDSYPHEFSGGMRQRLGIALAIAFNPPLVIADEPTTSLDVLIASQIMSELTRLCDELGTAMLLISHDLALAGKWCHRTAILDQGKIVESAPSEILLNQPQSLIGKELVKATKSRQLKRLSTTSRHSIILEAENLRCWYACSGWPWQFKWFKAVDNISFKLLKGETLGIVGASGCGKSTLCRALMGLVPIRGGIVKLSGIKLLDSHHPLLRQKRIAIQMVFQDPLACLNPKMIVSEAIADPFLLHKLCNKSQAKEKVRELLTDVGLTPPELFEKRYPHELSGGQQQRVAIARSISLRPKVLICDESISMLDAEIQVEILSLLKSLQKRLGLAILFVTHDLLLANGFCDRIFVMDNGQIIEEGLSEEIFHNPQSSITKNLINACPKLS